LPGTYIAWISTSTSDARDRLGNARGWRRPDGIPFADTVTALVTTGPYSISLFGADGSRVDNGIGTVITGTSLDGTYAGAACSDLSAATTIEYGSIFATGATYTAEGQAATCTVGAHMLCLGVDRTEPVVLGPPSPGSYRRAFITAGTWTSGG